MNTNKILVAIDDSDIAQRVVAYVAQMVRGKTGVHVRLFHILPPLPPRLLEFPGTEDPQEEARMNAELHAAQERWVKQAEQDARPILENARAKLLEAEMPAQAVEVHCTPSVGQHEVAALILEAARASQCGMIVVGKDSYSRLTEFFHQHVGDKLQQKEHAFDIQVVE